MGKEVIQVDNQRIIEVVAACLAAREKQQQLFSPDVPSPETGYINLLKQLNDDRLKVNAWFLTSTLVFGGNTRRLFDRISDPEKLAAHLHLFQPELVVTSPTVESDCIAFFNPSVNIRSIKEWSYNCQLLHLHYSDDAREFFVANGNDAVRVVQTLEVKPAAKNKTGFHRFGPKLSRYMVLLLKEYDLCPLENTDAIGIPVDYLITQIMIMNSGVDFSRPLSKNRVSEKTLIPVLTEIIKEQSWTAWQVMEALWRVGNLGCNPRLHELCPLVGTCSQDPSSRALYDAQGLFLPPNRHRIQLADDIKKI